MCCPCCYWTQPYQYMTVMTLRKRVWMRWKDENLPFVLHSIVTCVLSCLCYSKLNMQLMFSWKIPETQFQLRTERKQENSCFRVSFSDSKVAEKNVNKHRRGNEGACYESDLIREMDGRKGGMLLSRLSSSSQPGLFSSPSSRWGINSSLDALSWWCGQVRAPPFLRLTYYVCPALLSASPCLRPL